MEFLGGTAAWRVRQQMSESFTFTWQTTTYMLTQTHCLLTVFNQRTNPTQTQKGVRSTFDLSLVYLFSVHRGRVWIFQATSCGSNWHRHDAICYRVTNCALLSFALWGFSRQTVTLHWFYKDCHQVCCVSPRCLSLTRDDRLPKNKPLVS